MWLLVDAVAVGRFTRTMSVIVNDEPRRYYCTTPEDERLALVVCRDLRLEDLAGLVVDAAIGWDKGTAGGYVFAESRLHSKVTVYRVLHDQGRSERSLTDVLDDAPRRKTEE